jgi:heterodisulfide reductase subunit C
MERDMAEEKDKKELKKLEPVKEKVKKQEALGEAAEAMESAFDFTFRDEIAAEAGGEHIKHCFACGTCAAICPVTGVDEEFNCRRIVRQILFGMRKEVLSSPVIWLCLICARCYVHCPQKVNFPDVMRILRHMAIKGNYVSSDIIKKIEETDNLTQNIRHDLVKYTFEKKQEFLERIKQAMQEKMK